MDLRESLQNRITAIQTQRQRLVQQWAPYINAVERYVKENNGRELSVYDKHNMAVCLENATVQAALMGRSKMFEATTETDVAFLGIQLPVIAALLPSLVLNDVAIVQALDRRQGSVFYLDVDYGTTKGSVTAGESMLNAKTGVNRTQGGRHYAISAVRDEGITMASQDGGITHILGSSGPTGVESVSNWGVNAVTLGTVTLYVDGVAVATDDHRVLAGVTAGTGSAVDSSGITFTLTASTGTLEITYANVQWHSSNIIDQMTVNYEYTYDKVTADDGHPGGVAEANISMTASDIKAIDFTLRAKYSMGASIDLEKAHGFFENLAPSCGDIRRKAA